MNSGSEKKLSMDELLEKNRPAQMVQTTPQPPAQELTPPPEMHPTKAEWEELLSSLCMLGYHYLTQALTSYSLEQPLHAGVPHRETDWLSEEGQRTAGAASDPDADGRTAESGEASGANERTGWEAEREAFFSARHQTAQTAATAPGWPHMGGPADGDGSVASAVVGLGYRLEQSQSDAPVMDSTTMRPHTDRKTLRKKQQKKIAQGHAQDDHEEEQTWQQTM